MLEVPQFLQKGYKKEIGAHQFTEEDIIRYGEKFTPFDFHIDLQKAKSTVHNGLAANGFHIASVWMSLQRTFIEETTNRLKETGETIAIFGPSPGIEYMKWPHSVFAGDTVIYQNHIQDTRASNSRPDWYIMTNQVTGRKQSGEIVLEFQSSAFITLKKAT